MNLSVAMLQENASTIRGGNVTTYHKKCENGEDKYDKSFTCLTDTWVLKGVQILFGTNLTLSSF